MIQSFSGPAPYQYVVEICGGSRDTSRMGWSNKLAWGAAQDYRTYTTLQVYHTESSSTLTHRKISKHWSIFFVSILTLLVKMYFVHTLTHGKSTKSVKALSQTLSESLYFFRLRPWEKPTAPSIATLCTRIPWVTRDAKIVDRAIELALVNGRKQK